jgi:hypothetical protein
MCDPSLDPSPTSTGSHIHDGDFNGVCLHYTAFDANQPPSRPKSDVAAPKIARDFPQLRNLG